PERLFAPARRNSRGLDLTDPMALAALDAARAGFADKRWSAWPTRMVAGDTGETFRIVSPATGQHVGDANGAGPAGIEAAITAAAAAAPAWADMPIGQRADRLRRVADLYEANAVEFYV